MTNDVTDIIPANLRSLRLDTGYTQKAIGLLLKIQRATYCNYENGVRTPPIETLISLAEIYHVSVDYLVRGTASPSTSGAVSREVAEIVAALPEPSQHDVLRYARYRKNFPYIT